MRAEHAPHAPSRDLLDRLLLAGLTFGAGVGVGLLLAPAPGDHVRQRLTSLAREASHHARARAEALARPVATVAADHARAFAQRHVPLADDFDVVDARDILDDLRAGRA